MTLSAKLRFTRKNSHLVNLVDLVFLLKISYKRPRDLCKKWSKNGLKSDETNDFLGPNPALVIAMPSGVNKVKISKTSSIFRIFPEF